MRIRVKKQILVLTYITPNRCMIKNIPGPYDRINSIYDISEEKPKDKSESRDVACSPMGGEGDYD